MVKIENLKKIIKNKTILDIPALTFENGKINCLNGHNGAGKTTLLHILALVSFPTQGKVFFQGEEVNFSNEKQLFQLRKKIVLVEQLPILFSGTVAENICFGLKMRKTPKEEQEKLLNEVLNLLHLDHLKENKAQTLSGGETQRTALARALILAPQYLILDEPTASVDKDSRELIENIILNLIPKTTIIMTSHSDTQRKKLSQNTIDLYKGRLGVAED